MSTKMKQRATTRTRAAQQKGQTQPTIERNDSVTRTTTAESLKNVLLHCRVCRMFANKPFKRHLQTDQPSVANLRRGGQGASILVESVAVVVVVAACCGRQLWWYVNKGGLDKTGKKKGRPQEHSMAGRRHDCQCRGVVCFVSLFHSGWWLFGSRSQRRVCVFVGLLKTRTTRQQFSKLG